MKDKQLNVYWIFMILALIVASVSAQNGRRTVALIFEESGEHITDFTLVDRLSDKLMMKADLKVIIPEEDSSLPKTPTGRFNLERLLAWGQEVGSRYIIYLQVSSRRVETKKRMSIPFILSRYVVEGRIEGSYCLIDLNRSKVVGNWALEAKVNGPRQWQVAEDYPDDPDLMISAPRKVEFLNRLEDKAVKDIMMNVRQQLRGR
jgi:hypothetical protein